MLTEEMKREVWAMISQFGSNRRGLVTSYQAQPPMAKVQFMPPPSSGEIFESGWIPVLSQWVGNGWGLVAPLQEGDQVALMCEEADGKNYVIVGRYFSDVDQAPAATPAAGELLIQHETGALFSLKANGSIEQVTNTLNIVGLNGGNATVNINGNLTVTGVIS